LTFSELFSKFFINLENQPFHASKPAPNIMSTHESLKWGTQMEDGSLKNQHEVLGKIFELIHQMSSKERLSLLEHIEHAMNRDICLEEREFQRKSCTITVDYLNLDRAITDYIRDISPSGIFMVSRGIFQMGDEIFLRINFPDEQNPFKIPAKVIRTTKEGVGLKFKFQSHIQKEIISSLIKGLKQKPSKPD
jgi:Tfp pilus assembly protein PilZ